MLNMSKSTTYKYPALAFQFSFKISTNFPDNPIIIAILYLFKCLPPPNGDGAPKSCLPPVLNKKFNLNF